MNLNSKQIISIVGAVVSVLMISTAQLTDLFGPGIAKTIVSVAGLVNLTLQSVMAALTSQGNQVKDVRSMTGVENIEVNAKANPTLAALAVDPAENKISIAPGAIAQVTATAKAV